MASVDNLFAVISVFAFAIFLLTMTVFWNGISSEGFWDLNPTSQQAKSDGQTFMNSFDFIFLCAYFGIHLGILALAYLLRTHPVVFIAGFFISMILLMISAPLSNAYEALIVDGDMVTAATSIPITNYFMLNLPMIEAVFSAVTLIIMFGLARNDGGYG